MVMKRETICINGFWVSKKNYVLSVIDSEGVIYDTPKIKVSGIIKNNIPVSVREDLKKFIFILLEAEDRHSDESMAKFNDFVSDATDRFRALSCTEMGQTKQVNFIESKTDASGNPAKGCPVHSSGAIYFNRYIKNNDLKQYIPIAEGDKMKYVYLKKPNSYGYHVMGYKDEGLPEEFDKMVDVDMMLEKGLYGMLDIILSSAGIQLDYARVCEDLSSLLGR